MLCKTRSQFLINRLLKPAPGSMKSWVVVIRLQSFSSIGSMIPAGDLPSPPSNDDIAGLLQTSSRHPETMRPDPVSSAFHSRVVYCVAPRQTVCFMFLQSSSISGRAAKPAVLLTRLTGLRLLTAFCVALGWFALGGTTIDGDKGALVGVILLALTVHSTFVLLHANRTTCGRNDLLIHILLDSAAVYGVVLISGGTENPFIYYLLVLVAISATLFESRVCWLFTFTAVAGYSVLFLVDIKGHFAHMTDDFQLHLIGMWINFVGSALLVTFFISRLATALRDQQSELTRAREDTLKAEQLAGIGTLAASTVHALGTPLSTLSVMLDELRAADRQKLDQEDINVMLIQIARCKSTMQKLSLLAEHNEADAKLESAANLFQYLQEHYAITRPTGVPIFRSGTNIETCLVRHSLLLRHALINLVDNALDAANCVVTVSFRSGVACLYIDIEDDGDGFPKELRGRIGQPVVSTKKSGLGIGLFLANSTIEKLGGSVCIINHGGEGPDHTTVLRIQLPTAGSEPEDTNPGSL